MTAFLVKVYRGAEKRAATPAGGSAHTEERRVNTVKWYINIKDTEKFTIVTSIWLDHHHLRSLQETLQDAKTRRSEAGVVAV